LEAQVGTLKGMLTKTMHHIGLRSWHLQLMSFGSIALCVALWGRAKTIGEDERANAERRAVFVGLWSPMFWIIGDSIEPYE
jgi:hypothetical protein